MDPFQWPNSPRRGRSSRPNTPGSPNRRQPPLAQSLPAAIPYANVPGPSALGRGGGGGYPGQPHSPHVVGTTYSTHGIGRGAGYAHPHAQVGAGHGRPPLPLVGRGPHPAFPQPQFSDQLANGPQLSGSYSPGGSGLRQQNGEHAIAPEPPLHGYPGSQYASGGYHPIGHVADPFTAGPVLPGWRPRIGHGTPSSLPPPPPPGPRPILQPDYIQPPSVPHSPRPAGNGIVPNQRNLERMTATGAQYQGETSSRNSLGGNYSTGHAMGPSHTGQFRPTGRRTENTPLPQSSFDLRSERHRSPVAQPLPTHRRKRKALIIGINYTSHHNPHFWLRCCNEDAHSMANFLCDHLGFEHRDVRIMTDTTPRDRPTKANILAAMSLLVHDAQPGHSFFFYFSGHGTQTLNTSGGETDGWDECICAMDYVGDEQFQNHNTAGIIVDDCMYDLLVRPLPRGCRLTAIFDCCHSGTILDLRYLYSHDGTDQELTPPHDADVISIGASRDNQLAREANGRGALSSAFIECMDAFRYNVNYRQLIQSLCDYMRARRFPQRPLLSSSHEIDINRRFII